MTLMSNQVSMHCARCASPLVPVVSGGWAACCKGGGYWSNVRPLDDDLPTKPARLYLYYQKLQGMPVREPK